MKLKFLLLAIICFTLGYSQAQDKVTVSGNKIYVNGVPYKIRGVCYNPVPVGSSTWSFSQIDNDISLMVAANINTIRTYAPITDKTVLDKFAAAGIKIIMGFSNNTGGWSTPDISYNKQYTTYITTYKDHNAILMWQFGNEYNYHPEWFSNNVSNWYTILNTACQQAHLKDANHPTSTAHGGSPDQATVTTCSAVDVWSMNVYEWDTPNNAVNRFTSISGKPIFLSEAGADSYNNGTKKEDQQSQATYTTNILNNIFSNKACSGVTLFEFTDEWNKATGSTSSHDLGGFSMGVPPDNYANEEWWGILDVNRVPKLAYNVVKSKYALIKTDVSETTINSIESQFTIAPNPISTVTKIIINSTNAGSSIVITDLQGNTVDKITNLGNNKNLEISWNGISNHGVLLPDGLYIVSLLDNESVLETQKLLIIRK